MANEREGFRVAIVGTPGSGKSSVARRLAEGSDSIFWVEASRDLIERREYDPSEPFVSRQTEGFEFFLRASEIEGPDWAARRLLGSVSERLNILVTGIRGIDNLRALKKSGFFALFLHCSVEVAATRVARRENIEGDVARRHIELEEDAFGFAAMRSECHFEIDTSGASEWEIERKVFNVCLSASGRRRVLYPPASCATCAVPRTVMPMFTLRDGECDTCYNFRRHVGTDVDKGFIEEFLAEVGQRGNQKVLLGFSGGKDSSVALHYLLHKRCNLETFTVDMGYYPITSIERARTVSEDRGVDHSVVDGRQFITSDMRSSYEMTAAWYDALKDSQDHASAMETYLASRKHYSAKDCIPSVFPRVCVLCRKSVIRAYYSLARQKGAKYIVLGINEWAGLSASESGGVLVYSGVRRLAPEGEEKSVYVVHLPFILGMSLTRNMPLLKEIGWVPQFGEGIVETNSNSCLLAKASEKDFFCTLGFHPDVTRLSREITVGFLPRSRALHVLSRLSDSAWSVRQTLQYAEILR